MLCTFPNAASAWRVQRIVAPSSSELDVPSIAINARGAAVVAWEARNRGGESVQVATRSGRRARWHAARRLGPPVAARLFAGSALPKVTALTDGRFVILWKDARASSFGSLLASVADSHGRHLSSPQRLTAAKVTSLTDENPYRGIAAGRDGSATIVWVQKTRGRNTVSVEAATLAPHATRFSAPVPLAPESRFEGDNSSVWLASSPRGSTLAMWSAPGPLMTALRPAGSSSFLPSETLPGSDATNGSATLALGAAERFVAEWEDVNSGISIAQHPSDGGSWSPASRLAGPDAQGHNPSNPESLGSPTQTLLTWCPAESQGQQIAALTATALTAPIGPAHPSLCGPSQFAQMNSGVVQVFPDRHRTSHERRGGGAARGLMAETVTGSPPAVSQVVPLTPANATISEQVILLAHGDRPVVAWINAMQDGYQTSLDVATRRSNGTWSRSRLAGFQVFDIAGSATGRDVGVIWTRNRSLYIASG